MIQLRKGLDLPIAGVPDQRIDSGPTIQRVALLAPDYVGMKPTMEVKAGDRVKRGSLLFTDKKTEGVRYTSPAAGTVAEVNRGAKRAFQSVVIQVDGDEEEKFASYASDRLPVLTHDEVVANLVASGLWTSLRTRPFSKVPSPQTRPHSIFVQAIDSNPLAANPRLVIAEQAPYFVDGLHVIRHLTTGAVYLCTGTGTQIPGSELNFISHEEFEGPHPAGLPGTHIHFLDPVSTKKTVWYIGYQDVIAIGKLFTTGSLDVSRVISLAGPQVADPRLVRTRIGANMSELTVDQLLDGENRVISGSVLSGRAGTGPLNYLGRYHTQVSVIREGRERELLGWQKPGFDKFSVKRVYAAGFAADARRFPFTSNRNGSRRAMVPIGMYEQVMPLDILPTFLLRALITHDIEQAQQLGALELDEEDLGLCTFVCPGKYEYGPLLRESLTTIEREG